MTSWNTCKRNGHKWLEYMNYTIVMYGETFYDPHTGVTPAVAQTDFKGMTLESNEYILET